MQNAVSDQELDGLLTPVAMLFEILGEAQAQAGIDEKRLRSEASLGELPIGAWRVSFLEALKSSGLLAQAHGIKSISHLASLLSPYLRQSTLACDLESAQTLTASLFSLLAGDLNGDEAIELYRQVKDWVKPLTPLPASVDRLMAERLAADSELLQLAYASRRLDVADLDEETPFEPLRAPALEPEPKAVTVALDELDMVSEAWRELCESLTIELTQQDWDASDSAALAQKAGSLAELREKLENLCNALRFMTLEASSDALGLFLALVTVAQRNPSVFSGAHQIGLMRWTMAWSDAFHLRSEDHFAQAFAAMSNDLWRYDCDPEPAFARALAELRSLVVIESRQIALRGTELAEEDFSLHIPPDADLSVVEQLLLELPQLSGEFSAHIEALVAGSLEALGDARRVAHTLKGSANTVGIRGIAHLTHCLEDLLQLLDDEGCLPEAGVAETLSMAADCLAETSDAVAGHLDAPTGLSEMYALISTEINVRVQAKNSSAGFPAPLETPTKSPNTEDQRHWGEEQAKDLERPLQEPLPLPPLEAAWSTERSAPAVSAEQDVLRVAAPLVEKLIEFNTDTALLMSQAQDRMQSLDALRQSMRWGGERLTELADELERMVDLRGLNLQGTTAKSEFDALEMDQYNDLHTLSRRIAEASADARLMHQQVEHNVNALKENLVQIERVQLEVRETTLQTRMVPVAIIVPRLHRAARQAMRMAGKSVELLVTGEQTSIEAQLLQQIVDSLGHLIRNSIDHGIESQDDRVAAGKPSSGQIRLTFRRIGATVEILCEDDGAGLRTERIRERAVALGLVRAELADSCSDEALAQWITVPGFSTKTNTSQLSGRGIGMDVVQQTVRRMRGHLLIETRSGLGASFKITLPIRVATLPVLVTQGASQTFAISVRGLQQLMSTEGLSELGPEGMTFQFQGERISAFRLEQLIGLPSHALQDQTVAKERRAEVVVLVKAPHQPLVAVVVPELSQTRNVVVRALPSYLPAIVGVEGAAVLGDGTIAPVVDLVDLVDHARQGASPEIRPKQVTAPPLLCMIVDDSVSVRRSTELFIADMGMSHVSASDGIDALDLLQKQVPDLFLIDLEMPRMNGVELTRAIRADVRTQHKPIVMISSRNSQKHRDLAMAAGVDVFLTKPFTEEGLSQQIEALLTRA